MNSERNVIDTHLKSEAGFSLVELMIAIAIFAIGVMAVASLQVSAIAGNGGARKLSDELVVAESLLEELMAQPYDTSADLSDTSDPLVPPHTRIGGPSNMYTMTWEISMLDLSGDGTDDAKQVELTVTHNGNADRTTSLQLLIPDPNA
jgi:prepilin-type N-terminal cleavage/methylation domain-containing protein